MVQGCRIATDEGTPQGGPLSPLLADIMLDELDKELEKRGHNFCRYVDDCNIYVRSKRAGKRVMDSVRRLLENRLKLKVNKEKSAVDRPWKRKFLGFSFTYEKEPRIRLAPKAVKQFKDRIRKLTKRSWSISMDKRIKRLNAYILGWIGYFRLADTLSIFETLDGWIRRRLRACLLKQWKRPRTRFRNLVALGIPEWSAREVSGSSKGLWRLERTPQMNKALSISYWCAQGLHTLVGSYQKFRIAL